MQKINYFLSKEDYRWQMHQKSIGYTDTVLFPAIGNAVYVQSPGIGKPYIYRRQD
jgi:hypothetical protein